MKQWMIGILLLVVSIGFIALDFHLEVIGKISVLGAIIWAFFGAIVISLGLDNEGRPKE